MKSEARSGERIAILPNTVTYSRSLQHTACDLYIEKVLYMKTGEEPYCKVYQSPRLPRAVLTPNLHHGRQDPPSPDARKSTDHQREQSVYRETCRSLLEDTRRKHPGESQRWRCTGKPVAVTLSTEFHVFLTQPSKKKIRIARKPSKD